MKPLKTLSFIFGAIALLALLCWVFPAQGIQVGTTHLEFPSLADVLQTDNPEKAMPQLSAEELLAQQLREMEMQEEQAFHTFCRTSHLRFAFPDDDTRFFAPLFQALDSAKIQRMRIVHYGDSQLEGDRITGVIREHLQQRFGGMGPGMLPLVQNIGSIHTGQSCSAELPYGLVFGPDSLRGHDNRYGPMGQVTYLDGTAHMGIWARSNDSLRCHRFDRITVMGEGPSLSIQVKNGQRTAGTTLRQTFHLADTVARTSLTLSGTANIYGILVDGETGVCMDNIPMRGCSGTIFTGIRQSLLTDFYQGENVRLIIYQYGGNSVPYLRDNKGIGTYAAQVERQIRHLRQCAPQAQVLMIGPSDMSTRQHGEWITYPMLPTIIDSLRTAANRAGAAYWDMYQVMGGHNSMAQWCHESPALAGPDHIHFTMKGADRVADLFYKALMVYYDYYTKHSL